MFLQWSLVFVCASVVVFIFVKYRKKAIDSHGIECDQNIKESFDKLQFQYLRGFAAAAFADWLYGPYIYQLYKHYYNYDSKMINTLYITGYFSSMCFGTLVGYLADTYGRKRMCLWYVVFGTLSCLCKTTSLFGFLLLGHVFSGINASILASIFNVWYMHEHLERFHFPREWLDATFTTATFINGIMAIAAGATADLAVYFSNGSLLAPFIIIMPVLMCAAIFMSNWEENRGIETDGNISFFKSLNVIFHLKDFNLLLMGAVQSLMEASVYAFVMVWPPLLAGMGVPQGIIFAMLMASLSSGAITLHSSSCGNNSAKGLVAALHIATLSFLVLATLHSGFVQPSAWLSLLPALTLEFSVGVYFPSFGSLLSVIVPEAVRASVSNLYRLPMNLFMCGLMVWSNLDGHQEFFSLFSMCLAMTSLASGAGHLLLRSLRSAEIPKIVKEFAGPV